MNTHSSYSRAMHPFGGTTMKTITSLAIGAIALSAAGAVSAQEILTVTGNAESICELPDDWRFISSNHGASSSEFASGSRTWTIPSDLVAETDGMAVSGGEVAIRIRGEAFCNTAHTITLSSERGGLVADVPAVPGFANRRAMLYTAHWSNLEAGSNSSGVGQFYGGTSRGINNFNPPAGGGETTRNFANFAPPGLRPFDLRLSMPRSASYMPSEPLVAGAYQDVITITIGGVS